MHSLQTHCKCWLSCGVGGHRVQVERPINPGCTKKKKKKFQFQLLLHRLLTFWSEITHIITQNMQAFAAYPQGRGWRWGGAPQILKVRGNTTLSEQQAFPVKSRQQCEYSVAAACSLASLVFHPRRPRTSHEGPLDVCLTAWTLCLCDGRGLKDDGRWQMANFPTLTVAFYRRHSSSDDTHTPAGLA